MSCLGNNDNADSAPQQVVNGWVAKDLAIVQLNQLGDLTKAQEQTNKILALGVAAVSLMGVLLMLLVGRPRLRPGSEAMQAMPLHEQVPDPILTVSAV